MIQVELGCCCLRKMETDDAWGRLGIKVTSIGLGLDDYSYLKVKFHLVWQELPSRLFCCIRCQE